MRVLLGLAISCLGCGRSGFAPLHADATGDASSDAPAASCLPAPLTTLAYATPDFGDFQTTWATGGNGSWTVTGGALVQQDPAIMLAFAYRDVGAIDYRVRVHQRVLAPVSGAQHAIEIVLRADGANANMYHCDWQPDGAALIINGSVAGGGTPEFTHVPVDRASVPDPYSVTMEAQVVGARLECCLVGIPGAFGAATDTRFATGAVGLKAYFAASAFDHFELFR